MGVITKSRAQAITDTLFALVAQRNYTTQAGFSAFAQAIIQVLQPVSFGIGAPTPTVNPLCVVGELYCNVQDGQFFEYTPSGWSTFGGGGMPGTVYVQDHGTPLGAASTLNFEGGSTTTLLGAVATVTSGGWGTFGDDDGMGNLTGFYREVTGTAFPTAIIWWTSPAKLVKVREKLITWTGAFPTTVVWKFYRAGVLVKTITDTITYSGAFETSRTRVIV